VSGFDDNSKEKSAKVLVLLDDVNFGAAGFAEKPPAAGV